MDRFIYKTKSFSVYRSRLINILERQFDVKIPKLYIQLMDAPNIRSQFYFKLIDLSELDKVEWIQEIMYNDFGSIYYDFNSNQWLDKNLVRINNLPRYLIKYYNSKLDLVSSDERDDLESAIEFLSKLK